MALRFVYGDRRANWTAVDLGTNAVRLGKWAVTSKAYMGEIGTSTIPIDDPNGDVGHAGDQILGLKLLTVYESSAPANNQIIGDCFTRDRKYTSADSLITNAAVRIEVDLADRNDEAHYYLIPGDDAASGDRPAETVDARIAWLLASTYIALADNGLVASSSVSMPATNYGNQTGADVLDQCALAAGFNWGLYYDESAGEASLRFYDPNTSTLETKTLRVSNTLSDVDSDLIRGDGATHTWGPMTKIAMRRSPQDTAALYRVPWMKGTVSASRSSTADTYGRIDAIAPDANLTTADAATARANFLLWQHRNEEDTFDPITLHLPPAHVNDVREGSRISCRFRNMPGYHDWSWFRVTTRTVGQEDETDEFYTVTLEIVPCEDGGVTIVQTSVERNELTNTSATNCAVGDLLVYVAGWRQLLTSPQPPADGETWTFIDQGTFVDDHDAPDPCAVTVYACIATIAQKVHTKAAATGGSSNGVISHSVLYEIRGADVSDISSISSGPNAPASTFPIGSLGTVFPQQLAIGAWGNGWDGFFVSPSGIQTTTPGSWTQDYYASRDFDNGYAGSNVLFGAGFPFTWYGHLTGAGAAVAATTSVSDDQTPHHWGGVAVVIG
jgi:hypothetical protein